MNEIIHNNLITTTKFKITSADTDIESRIRIGSLINLLIQSAINSADHLGFGFKGLEEQKLFWVLSRLTLEITQPAKWYDEVAVDTWPKDVERIMYIRDFEVKDGKNKIIARATSGWLAIDLKTKRPRKIDGLHEEMFYHLKDKHGIKELPEKIDHINEGKHCEVKSTFFDIDLNKHVTATRYIDWMMDTFPLEFLLKSYPAKLT